MKKVAIISTGSELVYGSVHEANCYYISGKLFPTDLNVVMHVTVGDRKEDLENAVRECEKRADIVFITGGLGPTDDDNTLDVLKGMYGFKTKVFTPGKERMERFFKSIDRAVMKNDIKQVTVPEGAVIFENEVGLAAGFSMDTGNKKIIVMPGVPVEMEAMFENKVLPCLFREYAESERKHLKVRTILMREAEVNDLVKEMDINLDEIEWGITTVWGMNTLTFVEKGGGRLLEEKIMAEAERLFGDKMLSPGAETLEEDVVSLLRSRRKRLAVAESCTGGLIQKRITDIAGASDVFPGGIVSYSNEAKINLLGINEDTIKRHGAVSEETAIAMAEGVMELFKADIGLSVTGIAGPSGGSEEKPVGTVYIGFAVPGHSAAHYTHVKASGRDRVRQFSSQYAMDIIRLFLKKI